MQASTDHLSAHISYARAIGTDFTRQGVVDAMRQRHSYGATDNIVKVIGTMPIRQIDVIRGNRFPPHRAAVPAGSEFHIRGQRAGGGESYYYVRVIQVDDQMAWPSPIWVRDRE